MCEFWDRMWGVEKSTAKVADGVLVLSLPDALTPQLSRIDLGKVKNFTLEIWEDDAGSFVLGEKNDKGDKKGIAAFADRKSAVRALMAASRAMEQVVYYSDKAGGGDQGAVLPGPVPAQAKGVGGFIGKALTVLIGLVLLLFLIGLLLGGQMPASNYDAMTMSPSAPSSSGSGGVPMSADDFLRGRQ